LQWTEKDGLRFLRATDLQGKVVFEGPISTEEDLENLPEGVGKRLRAMQDNGQIPKDWFDSLDPQLYIEPRTEADVLALLFLNF